jgi:hypothetical protein
MDVQCQLVPVPQKLYGATIGNIEDLLDQIAEGLQDDDDTNLHKLSIARQYGPLLRQLKKLVEHGSFKKCLRERFPGVSYAKCNRWMIIAKHDAEVASALEKFPNVAWGPKKMINHLKGLWSPQRDVDDDGSENDTEEFRGLVRGEQSETVVQDNKAAWEDLAANAESAARSLGKEPERTLSGFAVTVTVFSLADYMAIQSCLSSWDQKSTRLHGSQHAHNVVASVPSDEIGAVLNLLGEFLASCPHKIKLNLDR